MRALLGTAPHLCQAVVLKLRTALNSQPCTHLPLSENRSVSNDVLDHVCTYTIVSVYEIYEPDAYSRGTGSSLNPKPQTKKKKT